MSLESYRVPLGVREGVELTLPGTDSVFRVKLPSQSNKPYQRALMMAAAIAQGDRPMDGGEMSPAALPVFLDAQVEAFGAYCLVAPLPDGLTFATLRDEYPTALDWITQESMRLARDLDAEASDAAKKSLPSSAGKTAGRGKATSTSSSSDPDASPSVTGDPRSAAMAG